MKETKKLEILLVDDDSIDRELFVDALTSLSFEGVVREASSGNEALGVLKNNLTTSFIILDLNMPLKDGRETLRELKSDRQLRHIPVVVLSTSNSHIDVLESYEAGACLFVEKPHDFGALVEMLKFIVSLMGKYVSFVKVDGA